MASATRHAIELAFPIDPWVDPRLSSVSPEAARSYLLAHRWKPKPSPRKEAHVFGGFKDDDGEDVLLIVPASDEMSDCLQRMVELIEALHVWEDRPVSVILTEMREKHPRASANGAASQKKKERRSLKKTDA